MNRVEIRAIIQEKSEWCVTITLPTHRTSPERSMDADVLQKSINYAMSILSRKNLSAHTYHLMCTSMKSLALSFDATHAQDGIGIFVSPDTARLVYFPFPVKEKIIIDKSFETRDLYYLEQFAKPYYLLKLKKDEARLFLVETGTKEREISNSHFPLRNTREYEYNKPSIGTSFGYASKGFEKDKSIINKIRQEPFFREVQQNLMPYLKAGDLLITGAKNIVANFESVKDKRLKIKSRIIGSFKDQHDMFDRVRSSYLECKHHDIQLLIDSLDELIGAKKVATGIRDVWANAQAGKGSTLLVEKDFRKTGYSFHDGQLISLTVPESEHETMPDIVDQIIEIIIDHGGKVVFTEENQLDKVEHIALILRY